MIYIHMYKAFSFFTCCSDKYQIIKSCSDGLLMTHRKVVNLNQFTEHKNLHKVSQLSEKVEKVP